MDLKNIEKTPYQVQELIKSMLQGKENVYLRGNYRLRLDEIREVINSAIKKYDAEIASLETKRKTP